LLIPNATSQDLYFAVAFSAFAESTKEKKTKRKTLPRVHFFSFSLKGVFQVVAFPNLNVYIVYANSGDVLKFLPVNGFFSVLVNHFFDKYRRYTFTEDAF